MKKLRSGQKVVFKGTTSHKGGKNPKQNEICILLPKNNNDEGYWDLKDYELDYNGCPQEFNESILFPLEEKTITLTLHSVKLEPKKVIESQPIHAQ